MRVNVYVNVDAYVYVHLYLYAYIYTCLRICALVCICIHAYMCIHENTHVCFCCALTPIHMCVCALIIKFKSKRHNTWLLCIHLKHVWSLVEGYYQISIFFQNIFYMSKSSIIYRQIVQKTAVTSQVIIPTYKNSL